MNTVLFLATSLLASTVILVLSMVIASAVRGGIDFGPLPVILLKTVPLLLAVSALKLVPLGSLLALPLWWVGLMLLFRLEFREARTLIGVNWAINIPIKIGLVLLFFNPQSAMALL